MGTQVAVIGGGPAKPFSLAAADGELMTQALARRPCGSLQEGGQVVDGRLHAAYVEEAQWSAGRERLARRGRFLWIKARNRGPSRLGRRPRRNLRQHS